MKNEKKVDPDKSEIKEKFCKGTAKRDFTIHQNDIHIEIKEGDSLEIVPKRFEANLKTEKVV